MSAGPAIIGKTVLVTVSSDKESRFSRLKFRKSSRKKHDGDRDGRGCLSVCIISPRFFFSFFFFLHVLRLCATLWVMTDLFSVLYVHFPAWHDALYSITISALSRHSLFVAFGLPLLIPAFFQIIRLF